MCFCIVFAEKNEKSQIYFSRSNLKGYKDSIQMFKLIKIGNQSINDLSEYGSEEKTILDEFYSVHFFLNCNEPSYIFKLRNIPSKRPSILVKRDSSVFRELNVGDILDMEYSQSGSLGDSKIFKTLITSKIPHDRYKGHSIVELSIIDI
jgi:hypothetical protein